jgi:hypothetical protein
VVAGVVRDLFPLGARLIGQVSPPDEGVLGEKLDEKAGRAPDLILGHAFHLGQDLVGVSHPPLELDGLVLGQWGHFEGALLCGRWYGGQQNARNAVGPLRASLWLPLSSAARSAQMGGPGGKIGVNVTVVPIVRARQGPGGWIEMIARLGSANRLAEPGGVWNVSIVTRPPLVSIVVRA